MESPTISNQPPKQPLVNRLGFFVLGGVGSASLNYGLLTAANHFFGWPDSIAYAFSVGLSACVLFFWSYYVNFRTSLVWKNCLGRYIACFLLALLINYLLGRSGLKHYGTTHLVRFLIVACVQSFTGGIKFLLYHFWVFPYADPPQKEPAPAAS